MGRGRSIRRGSTHALVYCTHVGDQAFASYQTHRPKPFRFLGDHMVRSPASSGEGCVGSCGRADEAQTEARVLCERSRRWFVKEVKSCFGHMTLMLSIWIVEVNEMADKRVLGANGDRRVAVVAQGDDR